MCLLRLTVRLATVRFATDGLVDNLLAIEVGLRSLPPRAGKRS